MYDVRCSSLPQYSTLVFTGSRPWIHWNNLLYSSQPFYRRLCEKSRCELYANCKFIISVLYSFLRLILLFYFDWIFNTALFSFSINRNFGSQQLQPFSILLPSPQCWRTLPSQPRIQMSSIGMMHK